MKFKVVIASLMLALSQLAFADMPPKPEHCPSAEALKSSFFFMAQKDEQGHGYVAISLGKYGTNDLWGFVMGFFEVDSMVEAVMKANEVLPTLRGNPDPMPVDQPEVKTWACIYGVKGGYQAITMSPLQQGFSYSKMLSSVL